MADQLAAPEDLAALLQQDVDTATATLLIEAATAVVQAVCGQRILRVVDDEIQLDGHTDSTLVLPERPVVAVSAVSLAGTALTAGTASGTYRLSTAGLWRDTGWAGDSPPALVAVTYTHGWADGAQELQLARSATLSLAKGSYANPSGVYSEKIDDYSVAYERASIAMEASPFLAAALRRQYGHKAGMVRIF